MRKILLLTAVVLGITLVGKSQDLYTVHHSVSLENDEWYVSSGMISIERTFMRYNVNDTIGVVNVVRLSYMVEDSTPGNYIESWECYYTIGEEIKHGILKMISFEVNTSFLIEEFEHRESVGPFGFSTTKL